MRKYFISKVCFYFIFIVNSIYSAELNDGRFFDGSLVNEAKILILNSDDLVYRGSQVYSPSINRKLREINKFLIKRCNEKSSIKSFYTQRQNDDDDDAINNPVLMGVHFYNSILDDCRFADEVIEIVKYSFTSFLGDFFFSTFPSRDTMPLYEYININYGIISVIEMQLRIKINTIKNAINSLRINLERFEEVKNEKMYHFLSNLANDEALRNIIRLDFRDEIAGGIDNLDKSKTIKNYYDEKILFEEKIIKSTENCILYCYNFLIIPRKEDLEKEENHTLYLHSLASPPNFCLDVLKRCYLSTHSNEKKEEIKSYFEEIFYYYFFKFSLRGPLYNYINDLSVTIFSPEKARLLIENHDKIISHRKKITFLERIKRLKIQGVCMSLLLGSTYSYVGLGMISKLRRKVGLNEARTNFLKISIFWFFMWRFALFN